MRITVALFSAAFLTANLAAQDTTLADWQASVAMAQENGETEATVGRLTGTEDRVSLCRLDGAVTRLRCSHSTQRMVDGVFVGQPQRAE